MVKTQFYLTTTLPYVNAEPHIGFALEIVQADSLARYQRLRGAEVFFNFGTDEHGLKIYRKALESGMEPQAYVDDYAAKFDNLKKALDLSYNSFIRTTDEHHIRAAQEFWRLCKKSGDIYKRKYTIRYCVGCELEKTDSELEEGRCPLHPDLDLEIFDEENYFFRFSKYQKKLLDLYKKRPDFVVPARKEKEIKLFVEGGLNDFSISRLKSKMPWGVDVPDDPEHVMFVWFDALINYISAIGWPEDRKSFSKWWPVYQVAGKDNLRQQAAIWQAMLMSANLPNSQQIFIHGFITVNGQKISKSLGNVISPYNLVARYGTDAVRYYLLAKVHPVEDSDFTYDKFEGAYNSDLANGVGNLMSRVARLCESSGQNFAPDRPPGFRSEVVKHMESYRMDLALAEIWKKISDVDTLIEQQRPWELSGKTLKSALTELVAHIRQIGFELQPFLPDTSSAILKQFSGPRISAAKPLFPRL